MKISIFYKTLGFVILLSGCCFSQNLTAKPIYTKADSLTYEKYIVSFDPYKDMPINELLVKTAKHFLGKPYVASTLDKSNSEDLTINLHKFDCTTFVESCIALSKTLKSENRSFESFCSQLQQIRYRKGEVDGYSSRLHYVSDWMYEHEQSGWLKNISKSMSGQLYTKAINFMSSHSSAYKQMNGNSAVQDEIKKIESQLNKRGGYYVVSKDKIVKAVDSMKNGDLVVFSTSIEGLDFTHIGIITTDEKHVTFIHASSLAKKVIVEKKSLANYCLGSRKCDGIVILRLN